MVKVRWLTAVDVNVSGNATRILLSKAIFDVTLFGGISNFGGGIEMNTHTMEKIEDLDAICITLHGEERPDGSVFIKSPDLTLFSAVGRNEADALDNAMSLLVPYLEANIPDYVDLRRLRSPAQASNEAQEHLLPAKFLAKREGAHEGHSPN
jgi:hypothetical protein